MSSISGNNGATPDKRRRIADNPRQFRFSGLVLDVDQGILRRNKHELKLRPKSVQVLRYFLENPGRLISKAELMEQLWGQTVVTDDAVTQCIVDIRRVIDDKEQKIIRTVPRRGYRLDVPVDFGSESPEASPDTSKRYSNKLIAGGLALVLLTLIGSVLWFGFAKSPSSDVRDTAGSLAIAVLPFADMSDEGNLQYFADGIAEEILNSLAQAKQLRVIARTSSFSFRGRGASLKTIGEALNVQYVLDGSVRQSGDQVRISAQLIDVQSETPVWSASYDRQLDKLFVVQDEIADTVLTKLAITLNFERPQRYAIKPEAYGLYLQAKYRSDNADNQELGETKQLLRRSLELDAAFAPAWRELARLQWRSVSGPEAVDDIAILEAMLDRAIELDPRDPGTLAYKGWHAADVYLDMQGAARLFQRAFEVSPNDEDLARTASLFSLAVGATERAVEIAENGVRRNPLCLRCLYNLIAAYRLNGDLDKAEETARRFSTVFGGGHTSLGLILLAKGQAQDALNSFNKESYESYGIYGRVIALHTLRNYDERDTLLAELKKNPSSNPWLLINAYAWIGQEDLAFAAIARVLEQTRIQFEGKTIVWRGVNIGVALQDPMLNSLHGDDRWEAVLEQHKISEGQLAKNQLGMFAAASDAAE
ncbi:MAG: winged helix-turn-helix domain-containing protein [Pseudomonadota bacterium]